MQVNKIHCQFYQNFFFISAEKNSKRNSDPRRKVQPLPLSTKAMGQALPGLQFHSLKQISAAAVCLLESIATLFQGHIFKATFIL